MLKSTHRTENRPAAASSLPPGWTEHKAPSGHSYYYNAQTKQSTYTRPTAPPPEEDLQIEYGAIEGDREVQASINVLQEFHKHNDPSQRAPGHFTGGRSYQDRSRPNRQGDRSKSKAAIPNCEPWILVKTKLGRRFVYNTETKESLWKFPSEVMMAVIDMDRIEWETKKRAEEQKTQKEEAQKQSQNQDELQSKPETEPVNDNQARADDDYDSDEYEEVEVTDDEAEDETNPKRPRLEDHENPVNQEQPPAGPQEFNEDDIAWQIAAMEADEEDPGYDYPDDFVDEDEQGGMELTAADQQARFRSLLDDHHISPFSTFDALIDTNTPTANALISDDRWLSLPNMSSRRSAFDSWSRDRVAERNANTAEEGFTNGNGDIGRKGKKTDPKVAYLKFLSENATPKLYWPEFKRKWKKAPEMMDRHLADKDREKLYREYISKITKLSEADRRKELVALLKTAPPDEWLGGDVPAVIAKDLRFYGVRDEKGRQELVDGFIATFPKL